MDINLNYSIDKQNTIEIKHVLDDITNSIIENSNLIVEANKKDIEIYKKQIRIKELLKIVDNYKNNVEQFTVLNNKKKVIVYYGQPYLTLNVCIQALISQAEIKLCFSEYMNNVNIAIIEILKNVIQKNKMNNLINTYSTFYSIKEKVDIKNILNNGFLEDNITVIGDSTIYQLLKTNANVSFYPYNNITLYSNSDKFDKLKEAIFTYANENYYEVEIIYENSLQDFINSINQNKISNIAVLLTDNEDDKLKIKSELINKEIFINENPFINEYKTICNYLK